jgi:hypothetical protein
VSLVLSSALSDTGEFLRSFKTFSAPIIYIVAASIVLQKSARFESNNFKEILGDRFFRVALWASYFGFFELTLRYFFPGVTNLWYELIGMAGFSGVEYLPYGYMDYGFIFQGQRPLGLYGDMHTAPMVGILCAVYYYLNGNKRFFNLAIISVILTFRWTYIPALIFLLYIQSGYSRNKWVSYSVASIFILMIPTLFAFVAADDSGWVLIEHFLSGINIFQLSWMDLIFGLGYSGKLETDLGFGEVFILKYITFFGLLGFIYFMVLSLIPAQIMYRRNVALAGMSARSENSHELGKGIIYFLILIPFLGCIHYNSFFTPSSAFLYSYILATLQFNTQSNRLKH